MSSAMAGIPVELADIPVAVSKYLQDGRGLSKAEIDAALLAGRVRVVRDLGAAQAVVPVLVSDRTELVFPGHDEVRETP